MAKEYKSPIHQFATEAAGMLDDASRHPRSVDNLISDVDMGEKYEDLALEMRRRIVGIDAFLDWGYHELNERNSTSIRLTTKKGKEFYLPLTREILGRFTEIADTHRDDYVTLLERQVKKGFLP